MAISSSPKTPTRGELARAFGSEAWPPPVPYCVLDARGHLLACNARMGELLGYKTVPKKALDFKQLIERWPFFNENDSSRALLDKIARGDLAALPAALPAEAGLKTFRLRVRAGADKWRLVTAELVRRGDLMQDPGSRQALFRSLSHEIRTSVTALKGYVGMLDATDQAVRERMEFSLKRLESVVKRLEEFKAELGVDV